MAESGQRRVLIAMDGSEHSNYAFDWYIRYFREPHDFVILINCPDFTNMLHTPTFAMGPLGIEANMAALLEEESKRVRKTVHDLEEKLKAAQLVGKVKSVEIVQGKPGPTIVKQAEEEEADIIVTGTRGMGTLRRTLLGSVSNYILHHSHVPVLICRHKELY